MKTKTTYERKDAVRDKYQQTLDMMFRKLDGEDINPNQIRKAVHDIYKDELELIDMLHQYESEREVEKEIEIPSFMNKKMRFTRN